MADRAVYDHVFRWDLDKTYLETPIHDPVGLVKTLFEPAKKKRTAPGAPALLRSLIERSDRRHGVFFLSGSPRQMRRVLLKKLALDGIDVDGLILKPNLSNLLRGRFRALKEQIGYKLPALLATRGSLDPAVRETLFGDDAESDALVYGLYADLVAGRVGLDEAKMVLDAARAYPDAFEAVEEHLAALPERRDVVERIFIRLEGHSPPSRFAWFGPRVVPIANYFQAALVLVAEGHLTSAALVTVVEDLVERHEFDAVRLGNSLQDLARRGHLCPAAARLAVGGMAACETSGPVREVVARLADDLEVLVPDGMETTEETPVELVDYAGWLAEMTSARQREKMERNEQRGRTQAPEPPHL